MSFYFLPSLVFTKMTGLAYVRRELQSWSNEESNLEPRRLSPDYNSENTLPKSSHERGV